MPRTAPTVDGTPTFTDVVFKYIDANGDLRSDRYRISGSATDAEIEAAIALIATGTNTSLYEAQVCAVYAAVPNKSAATDAVFVSKDQNIVTMFKDNTNDRTNFFLPAPVQSLFISDTEQPDPTSALMANINGAMVTLFAGTMAPVSLRFTERRDKNPRVFI